MSLLDIDLALRRPLAPYWLALGLIALAIVIRQLAIVPLTARVDERAREFAQTRRPAMDSARSYAPAKSLLEERFAARCPALTPRERQVCARAALGMSVEATALDLAIAKTSVVTFRQRAYRRLGVTSPFELCRLVAN